MTLIQKRYETLSMIAEAVCKNAGIHVKQLTGEFAGRQITNARKVFSVLAKMYGIGIQETAGFLNYGHHSSIVTNQQSFFLLFSEDEKIQSLFVKSINTIIKNQKSALNNGKIST